MENDAAGQEVTTDSGIDQSSMEADYMSTYQLVDNDGNAVDGEPLDEPKQNETKTPGQNQQPAQPEKTDSTYTANQPDEYMKGFYKEDGSLDVEKAILLFNRQQAQPPVPPLQPKQQEQPQQFVPQQQPKQQEQYVDNDEQVRKNALAAIERQRYYMGQGNDAQTAMAMAERDINDELQKYFLESRFQKMQEEFDAKWKTKEEELKNEREVAVAEPQAQKNLMGVCSKYAQGMAAETLHKAIFDINIGGQFLLDLFSMQNPDKANLVGDHLQKSMNDWFVKNAAKNERFVETLAINAINRIQAKVYPELAKIIQKNGVARATQQHRNNPGPRTPQNPATHMPTPTSGAEHDFAAFFHDVPRDGGGRPHI